MQISDKQILFLDVDGVISPLSHRDPEEYPPIFEEERIGEPWPMYLAKIYREWLKDLSTHYELVWGSTWVDIGFKNINTFLELPELPFVDFPDREKPLWKLKAVAEYAGERPFVWIDDDISSGAFRWARQRDVPVLLIKPKKIEGLLEKHYRKALKFAKNLEIERGEVSLP